MATTKRMILSAGQTVAGFRVIAPIAAGGMAVVYEAEQIRLKRRVALKVLNERLGRDDAYRERFVREGMHIASLEHPNIVPVYDAGEEDGRLYIAMRFIDGETLGDLLSERRLTASETDQILAPIARALDAAHDSGIVHRDIKPGNILIDGQGHAFLADFGIARAATATHTLTTAGSFVGSVHYASPEQARGEPPSPASDIYSLSVVYFQCISGEVPFRSDTESTILDAHLTSPIPKIAPENGGSAELNAVLARGLAKDPTTRYERASELASAIAETSGARSASPAAASEPPRSTTHDGLAPTDTTQAPTPVTEVPTPVVARPTPVQPRPSPTEAVVEDEPALGGTVVIESTTVDPQDHREPPAAPKERRSVDRSNLALAGAVVLAILLPLLAFFAFSGGKNQAIASSGVSLSSDQELIRTSSAAAEAIGLNAEASSVYAKDGSQIVVGPYAATPKSEGDLPAELTKSLGKSAELSRVTVDGVPAVQFKGKTGDDQFNEVEGLVFVHGDGKHELVSCMNTAGTESPIPCADVLGSTSLEQDNFAAIAPTVVASKLLASAINPLTAASKKLPLSSGSFSQISSRAKTLSKEASKAADAVADPKGVSPSEAKLFATLAKRLNAEASALSALSSAAASSKSSKYSRYEQASKRLRAAQLQVRSAISALNQG